MPPSSCSWLAAADATEDSEREQVLCRNHRGREPRRNGPRGPRPPPSYCWPSPRRMRTRALDGGCGAAAFLLLRRVLIHRRRSRSSSQPSSAPLAPATSSAAHSYAAAGSPLKLPPPSRSSSPNAAPRASAATSSTSEVATEGLAAKFELGLSSSHQNLVNLRFNSHPHLQD